MNARELRIGNYLQNGVSKELLKVIEVKQDGIITYVEDRDRFPLEQGWYAEPIPLTEEWFIKFGWRTRDGSWYQCPFEYWNYDMQRKELTIHESSDGDSFNIKIEYVHQLQNVVFILTGRELEYK